MIRAASFGGLVHKMNFLVVSGAPNDVVVGVSLFEELQTCIDLGQWHVELTVRMETMRLNIDMDEDHKVVGLATDSEDFMSGLGAVPDD